MAQAFQGLIQQLLNGHADDIARWRDAIKEAVGNQGRLLTDLIPDLVRLIGPQPTVAVLSPVDAELRFQTVFQRFVGVFARAEHPLVIFVDDLQWLDPATLTLIEYLLLHPDTRHLLLIGAYRDNEVGSAHPLMLKLEALRRAGARSDQIVLGPLSVDDVNQLLCDTLRHAPDEICGLSLSWCTGEAAAIRSSPGSSSPVWQKKRLVEFDPRSRSWTWNLDAIVDKKFSDNPVDLMIGRLRRLAPEAQEALKLLACLGNHADFATLAKLRSESDEAVHASFRDAVRAGAAVPREGSYRFFHDRVQEAAYALHSDGRSRRTPSADCTSSCRGDRARRGSRRGSTTSSTSLTWARRSFPSGPRRCARPNSILLQGGRRKPRPPMPRPPITSQQASPFCRTKGGKDPTT